MPQDPAITTQPVAATPPAEATKPDRQDDAAYSAAANDDGIDPKYWLRCLEDAERAESDWRKRGREIIQIYRNDSGNQVTRNATNAARAKGKGGRVTFNILFANTETMLPAIYTKPPEPVVRARFTKPDLSAPPAMPPPMPPMGSANGLPPAMPPLPPVAGAPPPSPLPVAAPPPNGAAIPPQPPIGPPALPVGSSPGVSSEGALPGAGGGVPLASAAPPPVSPPMPAPPMPIPGTPISPQQKIINTAASVIEKSLEIVVEDELSHESVKAAIKDVLLPGRGCVRVRWIPTLEDGQKVWEEVNDEYVYWEDLLVDPVRAPGDTDWIAFRHLFTAKAATSEFKGSSPKFDALIAAGKVEQELCIWTEESAAKMMVGGGQPMRSAGKLGDVIRKLMVWEIWDRANRQIIWFVRELGGLVLRVDQDTYGLEGFYPIPKPMLAVTTTDTQIPKPFYDLYADLASDLDEISRRISNLTKQIKVRGAYNSASNEIASLLTAEDEKMIPVDGVDMINGGLSNHIWMVPILDFVGALKELYIAREQAKQAIYEIMGISDIMRGATKASETATAQRIKGSMGMVRLSDQKGQAANFVTDLLRMKAELIAKNFSAATLSAMTGEDVTPEVMAVLRSDFLRTCSVDIESDSTVVADEQEEQQSMQMIMMSVQGIMQGVTQMGMSGMFPPPMVTQFGIELLIMMLHPVRYSRGVIELLYTFQEQLQAQMAMPPAPPPMPAPPAGHPSGPAGGPPPAPHPAAKPNGIHPPQAGPLPGLPPVPMQ